MQNELSGKNFTEFMRQQIFRIERLRRRLMRRSGREITHEQAAFVWIERGYAALYRQHFETRNSIFFS